MSWSGDGPFVEAERLSFRFQGSEYYALRDLSLAIGPGEFVVVTGPSGCGKSTLALALGGFLSQRGQHRGELAGRLRVAGLDVPACPVYDLAEVVGLVQQNPEAQFCTLTVEDEVAFGLENRCLPARDIRERLDWALAVVGAGHLAGRELAGLSGGEKQKVAIAAVLAARPALLILDEPTSSLDPAATADVFAAIARIRAEAGLTVIVVEHKVGYLERFRPRLVVMAEGRVAADGPVADWRPVPLPGRSAQTADRPAQTADRPARTADGPAQTADVGQVPAVRVEAAGLGYGRAPVVRDLSLTIEPGEFVAVMGDNGSGKSTFLLSLLGLIKPVEGRVEVLGHDTRHTPVSRLARHVGLVFQNADHQLFAESVWREATLAPENLGLLDPAAAERARGLLAQAGLAGREADHPFRLSYGQKRRLNLVSVLGHAPRLLLLDEVLIGQDAVNAAWLLDLAWQQIGRGAAVVMVNHDPEVTRRYATRVLFFAGGRVVVDAPAGEAFTRLAALGRTAYLPAGEAAA